MAPPATYAVKSAAPIGGQLFYWVLGTVSAIALAGGSFWLTHVNNELARVRAEYVIESSRIAVLESMGETAQKRLARIEDKLDALVIAVARDENPNRRSHQN